MTETAISPRNKKRRRLELLEKRRRCERLCDNRGKWKILHAVRVLLRKQLDYKTAKKFTCQPLGKSLMNGKYIMHCRKDCENHDGENVEPLMVLLPI